jgi:hypothetical protein
VYSVNIAQMQGGVIIRVGVHHSSSDAWVWDFSQFVLNWGGTAVVSGTRFRFIAWEKWGPKFCYFPTAHPTLICIMADRSLSSLICGFTFCGFQTPAANWGPKNIKWKIPEINSFHNFEITFIIVNDYNCSILSLVIGVNLLLRLTYKLNFISIYMYIHICIYIYTHLHTYMKQTQHTEG